MYTKEDGQSTNTLHPMTTPNLEIPKYSETCDANLKKGLSKKYPQDEKYEKWLSQ